MSKNIVDFYAKLALNKGWIDYARQRVKELEKHESGMWVGLGQAVAQRIKELKNENSLLV